MRKEISEMVSKPQGARFLMAALISFLLINPTFGQDQQISGRVVDATTGEGLPGVTVQVKGRTVGAITDIDGQYTVNASSDDILVFTSIGFRSQEIPVGQQTGINVTLEEDVAELSEVVVIGYGAVQKKDLTGVVNKVTNDDFNAGALGSPKQLIAGKVPGVQIATDGNPRGGGSIRIRGGSSFDGNQEPLYVVDGIPLSKNVDGVGGQDPLSLINPNDIEDVTILKDASAAAIYGVQGAAGVIIITTKSGAVGKPRVSYTGNYGVSFNLAPPDMLTTSEFQFAVERKGPRNLDEIGTADTDWVDEVTRAATSQSHGISVSMGSKNTTARLSLNYTDLQGVLLTDRSQRLAPSLKLNQSVLNGDLNISVTYNGIQNWDRLAPNVMSTALSYAPTQPVAGDNELNGFFFEWPQPLTPSNPVSTIEQSFNQVRTWRNFVGGNIDYKLPFMEGLRVKANVGYDNQTSNEQYISLPTRNPDLGTNGTNTVLPDNAGGVSVTRGVIETRTYEAYLNYNRKIGDHSIDAIFGHSFTDFTKRYKTYSKRDTIAFTGYNINDPLEFLPFSYRTENVDILNDNIPFYSLYRLASIWGRVNYSFKDKYILTASLRNDGSSRFSPLNNFKTFPSLAFAWRIGDESFLGGSDLFDDLKLRVSWGITGNQDIPREFGYVDIYTQGDERAQYIIGGDTLLTYRPTGANPQIHWEETRSLGVGIDYSFLEGRINGSLDYYDKRTNDLLTEAVWPVGALTTFAEYTNIGSFDVNGVELIMNAVVYDRTDFSWNLNFNIANYTDQVSSLTFTNDPDGIGIRKHGIAGDVGQTIQVLQLGQRVNSFLVWEHIIENGAPVPDGVDRNDDGLRNELDMYVDQDGNGVINEEDLIAFNAPTPRVMMGLTSQMKYKNWDLSMTFRSQLGNYVYNNIASQFGAYEGVDNPFGAPANLHSSAFVNDFTERQLFSSVYVENASFLKLDNLTIGYNFETNNNLRGRVYLVGTNVLTITGYSGVDPEVGILGIDNNPYPRSRTFLLGLNLNLN